MRHVRRAWRLKSARASPVQARIRLCEPTRVLPVLQFVRERYITFEDPPVSAQARAASYKVHWFARMQEFGLNAANIVQWELCC